MAQKTDLRIVKTNRNIRNAFIELLNEKDFHAITVQDILDRALINRSTFYKHYSDKYDLVEAISRDFLAEFRSLTSVRFTQDDDFYRLMDSWDKTFATFYEQRPLILGLWKIRTEKVNVYDEMEAILRQQYIELADTRLKEKFNIQYQACIFAAVTMATLKYMMSNEKHFTAHELIEEIQTYYGIISIAPPKVPESSEG